MKKYGLVGYPLNHSFSKDFFNEKFSNEHIDAEYVNFEIPSITLFQDIITETPDLQGLNVTIPYKEKVISYLDEVSEEASKIGAVNVICVKRKNGVPYLIGHNSDVTGFTQSIEPLLETHHKKALILGTGGASKAVDFGLKKLGLETRFVSRRNVNGALTYKELTEDIIKEFTVIVNCTPVGMFPHTEECPDIPYQYLNENHLLYDLIYNPDETLFLKKGKAQGSVTKNGLEMLILQAYAGWNLWNNTNPPSHEASDQI